MFVPTPRPPRILAFRPKLLKIPYLGDPPWGRLLMEVFYYLQNGPQNALAAAIRSLFPGPPG